MSFSLASWVFRKHVSVDSVSTYALFEMLTSCFYHFGLEAKRFQMTDWKNTWENLALEFLQAVCTKDWP